MTSVYVVIEFFTARYPSDSDHQTIYKIFASKSKADQCCLDQQRWAAKNGVKGFSWEIQEVSFDGSM